MASRKGVKKVNADEQVNLGPKLQNGEDVFGVCFIYAGKNDTFIHVTDITGAETISRVSGGMKVKAHRDESSPYAAMLAAVDVADKLKQVGITGVHVRMRADGGTRRRVISEAGATTVKALARNGIKIGRLEDVTPIPHDTTRKKGGRRGRRM